jgi:NADH:ubiquinone oxidoreductase subunit H
MIDAMRDAMLAWGDTGLVGWTWERKVIGWMHVRHGTDVPVGIWGVLQAFADVFKLLFKEVLQPAASRNPCCSGWRR